MGKGMDVCIVMTNTRNGEKFSVRKAKNTCGWPRAENGWKKIRPERQAGKTL